VALIAVRGELTSAEIAKKFDIHPNLIAQWKTQLLQNAGSAFDGSSVQTEEVDVEKLHAKIGQLTLECDFLEKALGRVGGPSVKR
jgi:transposase-like protein